MNLSDILKAENHKEKTNPSGAVYVKKTCPVCGGAKVLPQYIHVANGKCFHCNGKGKYLARVEI